MDNTATPKRAIRFKLMPDGQIRGFRPNSTDKAGASEWQITPPIASREPLRQCIAVKS